LHDPIRILKIDVRTGKTIQRNIGSGLTRTGTQVTHDYLLVFGVHNPGCVHASDLSRFFPIIRCARAPRGTSMTYDMQYSGATIVGKQILYLNARGNHDDLFRAKTWNGNRDTEVAVTKQDIATVQTIEQRA